MPVSPTLPSGAQLVGEHLDIDLRALRISRPWERVLGGFVRLDERDLPGLDGQVALIPGTWFWPKTAVIVPLRDDVVSINDRPLPAGEPHRWHDGDWIVLDGLALEFVDGGGSDGADDWAGEEAIEEFDDEPDRRRSAWRPFQRASAADASAALDETDRP